ncbi:MAG: tRNA pseudouridine(55) synthase TruB [Marinilabiliales bacterium]|nr:MAG: tRNA pseudouridine(55) synthase TruB [Marinilabiliales bacterium]
MSDHNFDFQQGEVILIDKPYEWTSFDVVNHLRGFLRKVYGWKKLKVGHAGTLDPLATGLLIICTGRFTKKIDEYQGMDKVYVGSMHFGATTPSFDKETEIDNEFDISDVDIDNLSQVAKSFEGDIQQIPPKFSAIKIKGKRAFKYARQNEEVELKPRDVRINYFQVFNINLPNIDFAVSCSKGTYIRSLVRDLGEKMGKGAFLTELRRTQIGEFNVNNSLSLDDFKKTVMNNLENNSSA